MNRGALLSSASASIASTAALPSTAAASSLTAFPSVNDELAAVERRILDVEGDIARVENDLAAAIKKRDQFEDDEKKWERYDREVQRCAKKEEQLRKKEEQLRDDLKRKEQAAAVRSLARHGLPRLGPRRGWSSNPAENFEHESAQLIQQKFSPLSGLPFREGISSIWALHANGDLQSWASEMDVQQLVKAVLQDAITAAGLGHMLKCYNGLSIFKLRPDIWVVMNDRGVPVGVCEVKKPGRSIMNSSFVHGQIYDYMLRL